MKGFLDISFDPAACHKQVQELGELLGSAEELPERAVIQPFFRARPQLTAFIGSYAPGVGPADRLAYEFPFRGDFAADVVVGSKERRTYCLIELEDAGRDSVFATIKGKATKEWSRRFEHGFSQLVDWFYAIDDLKNTQGFAKDFGHGLVSFIGILIIGRSATLTEEERDRLRWRSGRVLVNSHYIHCLTFDELYRDLSWRISHYPEASRFA